MRKLAAMRSDTLAPGDAASVRSFMAMTSPNALTTFSRSREFTSDSGQ